MWDLAAKSPIQGEPIANHSNLHPTIPETPGSLCVLAATEQSAWIVILAGHVSVHPAPIVPSKCLPKSDPPLTGTLVTPSFCPSAVARWVVEESRSSLTLEPNDWLVLNTPLL